MTFDDIEENEEIETTPKSFQKITSRTTLPLGQVPEQTEEGKVQNPLSNEGYLTLNKTKKRSSSLTHYPEKSYTPNSYDISEESESPPETQQRRKRQELNHPRDAKSFVETSDFEQDDSRPNSGSSYTNLSNTTSSSDHQPRSRQNSDFSIFNFSFENHHRQMISYAHGK
jgi:hypothetical protein